MTSLEIVTGDITKLKVDVIVNAANNTLLGGGGVDGAIHKAAGKELLVECHSLGGCTTGEAKVTKGYNLPASCVIHTVGPIWKDGQNNESELLVSCYQKILLLANSLAVSSIAFPCISTGVYHFPKVIAANLAISAVKQFLKEHKHHLKLIFFCCYIDEDYQQYCTLLKGSNKKG